MALCTPYICTNILAAAAPPIKKLKKRKAKSRRQWRRHSMFMKSQADAEERFQMQDERWKEMEMEERQERRLRASPANYVNARADAAINTLLITIWV